MLIYNSNGILWQEVAPPGRERSPCCGTSCHFCIKNAKASVCCVVPGGVTSAGIRRRHLLWTQTQNVRRRHLLWTQTQNVRRWPLLTQKLKVPRRWHLLTQNPNAQEVAPPGTKAQSVQEVAPPDTTAQISREVAPPGTTAQSAHAAIPQKWQEVALPDVLCLRPCLCPGGATSLYQLR